MLLFIKRILIAILSLALAVEIGATIDCFYHLQLELATDFTFAVMITSVVLGVLVA